MKHLTDGKTAQVIHAGGDGHATRCLDRDFHHLLPAAAAWRADLSEPDRLCGRRGGGRGRRGVHGRALPADGVARRGGGGRGDRPFNLGPAAAGAADGSRIAEDMM